MSSPPLRPVGEEERAPASSARARAPHDPPAWLSAEAKRVFRVLVKELDGDAVGKVDVPSIALASEHYAIAQAAASAIRGTGNRPEVLDVDKVHGGHNRKTPAWQVFREASAGWLAFAGKYGLTLEARIRLELDTPAPLGDDQDDADFESSLG